MCKIKFAPDIRILFVMSSKKSCVKKGFSSRTIAPRRSGTRPRKRTRWVQYDGLYAMMHFGPFLLCGGFVGGDTRGSTINRRTCHRSRPLLTYSPDCLVKHVLQAFLGQRRAFEVFDSTNVFLHVHPLHIGDGGHTSAQGAG
jgi:hypothetical protein